MAIANELDKLEIFVNDKGMSFNLRTIVDIRGYNFLFTFRENDKVVIVNHSSAYKVSISCAAYMLNNKIIYPEDGVLVMQRGIVYTICDSNYRDLCYLPDEYSLIITNEYGFKFEKKFKVEFIEGSDESMVNAMSQAIEEEINSLLPYSKKRRVLNGDKEVYIADSSLSIFSYLKNSKDECLKHLNSLYNEIQPDVITSLEKNKDTGRVNSKALYKSEKSASAVEYSLGKDITFDTDENRALKFYLEQIAVKLNSEIRKLNLVKGTKEGQIKRLLEENERCSNADKVYNTEAISGLEESLRVVTHYLEPITKIANQMKFLLQCDKLQDVTSLRIPHENAAFRRKVDFLYFKKFKVELDEKKNLPQISLTRNRSTVIQEIYGLVLIQKVLFSLGYHLLDSTLSAFYNFKSDAKFFYEGEKGKAIVRYDHQCKYYQDETKADYVTINSVKNRPDYILELRNDDNKLIASFVFEIKYRSLASLQRTDVQKNSQPQSKNIIDCIYQDYSQLGYLTLDKKLLRGVIEKVFIIYPDKNKHIESDNILGALMGIDPSEDISQSEAFSLIKNEIEQVLD